MPVLILKLNWHYLCHLYIDKYSFELFIPAVCTSQKKELLSLLEGLPAADPSMSRAGTHLQIIISEKLSAMYFGPLETDIFFNTVFRTKENIPLYLIVLESTMRKMEKVPLVWAFLHCWMPFSLGSSFLLLGTQLSLKPCLLSLGLGAQHQQTQPRAPTASQGSARQSKGLTNCEGFLCEPWKGLRKRKPGWI